MRTVTRQALGLGVFLALQLAGCHNFDECNVDADCPSTDVTTLHCTADHLCVLGTPAGGLCTEIYPPNSSANAIVVGALVNLAENDDLFLLESFQLAIDQVNQHRGTAPQLALHICDISATADDPLKSMELLARERNAVAVVGPTSSVEVFQITDEVVRSGIPIMSPSATSAAISSLGTPNGPTNGLFYRVAPSDAQQGPVLAHQLPKPLPATIKLALLFVNDQYGTGLKDAFLEASSKQPDLTVPYLEPPAAPDLVETQLAADAIIAAQPDYVVAITDAYSDTVVKDLLNLPTAFPASKLIMADGAKNQNVLNLVNMPPQLAMNAHLMRVSGTAPTVDSSNQTGTGAYQNFVADFQGKWPGQDPRSNIYAAYAYDAVFAVAIAIGAAGDNVTPARVTEQLSHLNQADSTQHTCGPNSANQIVVGPSKYSEATDKMAMGPGLVLQGASGTICFNAHGDRLSGLYERWAIDTTLGVFTSVPTQ